MNSSDLPKIISDIQETLTEPSNICTRIGKAMGICGGSRRRKGKGKGKGKGKSRKTKKTNKKRKFNK
jgi:hypothetical protein